jgi:predicted XRE-type DNA-binding protein
MSHPEITIGSLNVFEDLGFSVQEAENLRIRSELMLQITKLCEAQAWSIEAAAGYLGVTIERLETLKQGKIGQFSIDELIAMLSHAGMKIRVEVLPAAA